MESASRRILDPRDLKKIIGEAFQFADSAKAFNAVLEQNAMQLARGDKRGFVVLHHSGEALPLHRFLGVKQKDVRARLGQPEHVQTVDQAREFLKDRMTAQAERQIEELKKAHDKERRPMAQAVRQLKGEQQQARSSLVDVQQQRQAQEAKARASKIRKGIAGLWDKAQLKFGTGPLARQFAAEIEQSQQRDRTEFHALKTDQLRDRHQLQKSIRLMQEKQRRERQQARSVLGHWLTLDRDTPPHGRPSKPARHEQREIYARARRPAAVQGSERPPQGAGARARLEADRSKGAKPQELGPVDRFSCDLPPCPLLLYRKHHKNNKIERAETLWETAHILH